MRFTSVSAQEPSARTRTFPSRRRSPQRPCSDGPIRQKPNKTIKSHFTSVKCTIKSISLMFENVALSWLTAATSTHHPVPPTHHLLSTLPHSVAHSIALSADFLLLALCDVIKFWDLTFAGLQKPWQLGQLLHVGQVWRAGRKKNWTCCAQHLSSLYTALLESLVQVDTAAVLLFPIAFFQDVLKLSIRRSCGNTL